MLIPFIRTNKHIKHKFNALCKTEDACFVCCDFGGLIRGN